MMKVLTLSAAALVSLGASVAYAEGDAAAGEALWRNCRSCHAIVADDGTVIQRGGRTGPNLYGLPGRAPASVEGFRYSDGLHQLAASEGGEVWTEDLFEEYVADPTGFLRAHLGNNSVRSPMSYRLASGAEDMWAYLVSVSPEAAPAE
ncbi:c-type cytochrome [Pararhodobacter sp.]|uniref:c-type cytochrome n=1 Tax=Pararhodobacter sp. TaxID=2127056 RepID=UPI002AFF8FE1|nr:cytochrome C [Pararhodobacter sp.]